MDSVRIEKHAGLEPRGNVIYNDGELALIDDIHNLDFEPSRQLDIFAIALVLEGKAQVRINGTLYEARKNDLFVCTPNNFVESGLLSLGCRSYCICVSTDYMKRVLPLAENSWDIRFFFAEHPICALSPEEAEVFCQYYNLLRVKVKRPSLNQKKVVGALLLAFIYDMQSMLDRVVQHRPRPFTASEELFKRFVNLLSASSPKARSVSGYAASLNVTPKYLSAVCKQVCGQRPSRVIDRFVCRDIEYLLKHSTKSIKEIACELDFPNLSFFGKYVKKHFGTSPKAYRMQALRAEKEDSGE